MEKRKMSVGKIILKSTTRMSLNDRFTVLRQEKPVGQVQGGIGLEERRQQAQASRRNQRLAAQMERRPAVVAALKLKKKPLQNLKQNEVRKQQRPINVKQRLAIKGRLSLPQDGIRRTIPFRGRGGLRGLRGATGIFHGINSRGFGFRGGRNFINSRGIGNVSRGGRGGMRVGMRGVRGTKFASGGGRGSYQVRGSGRGGARFGGVGGQGRGQQRNRGRGRGGRLHRGGRGARGNMQNGGNFTREQLDQQLDDYMSKNKNSFEDDDQHMSDAII
ncbi:hypothetical protein SK128_009900 [Halocaridina rubra]|uniref:Chromatin target of PRMT1 protein C-terminal domain-containing protein n=1 Tax=Halocaridina rubra TaxID=373956 RepID=A0AAN9AEZ9_HALRR